MASEAGADADAACPIAQLPNCPIAQLPRNSTGISQPLVRARPARCLPRATFHFETISRCIHAAVRSSLSPSGTSGFQPSSLRASSLHRMSPARRNIEAVIPARLRWIRSRLPGGVSALVAGSCPSTQKRPVCPLLSGSRTKLARQGGKPSWKAGLGDKT